jgi:AraC family transcriptional regulator
MLLVGIRRQHTFAGGVEGIPAQWREFNARRPWPGEQGAVSYGVMCGAEPAEQRFEYMCAVETSTFDGVPADVGRMRVPASRYAVYRHEGHISTVRDTWQHIWNVWLPASGLTMLHAPDFERYDASYDAETGEGGCEIWVPVLATA